MISTQPTTGTCAREPGRPTVIPPRRDSAGSELGASPTRLSADEPDRMPMRIAPRTLLCGTAWRVDGNVDAPALMNYANSAPWRGQNVPCDRHGWAVDGSGSTANFVRQRDWRQNTATSRLDRRPELTVGLAVRRIPISTNREIADAADGTDRHRFGHGDPTMGNLIVGSPLALALVTRGSPNRGWDKPDGKMTSTSPSGWHMRPTRCRACTIMSQIRPHRIRGAARR